MRNFSKRLLSLIISVAIALPCFSLLISCQGANGAEPMQWIKRELADKGEYDFSEEYYLPRNGAPESEIQYIDVSKSSNNDMLTAIVMQGVVNKGTPSMYVVCGPMIEGTVNASSYWLDKMDEVYPDTYTKKEYTDLYQMIMDNVDSFDGYVLYDARLADSKMRSRNHYSGLYGDMALLDLTIMLCSLENSIPLTKQQLYVLREEYGFDLTRKGDTTAFMLKDENGEILATDEARASREVWYNVFDYVLKNLTGRLNDNVLAHNPAFQIPSADYWVANEMLVYTRIFAGNATEKEKALEDALIASTKPNSPVVGVFYLQSDEGSYVPYLTSKSRSMVVTYETYNLSWTSGLPVEQPKQPVDRNLEVEEGKIYVSFDLSEGDNNSYHYFRVPAIIDEAAASNIVGWSTQPTIGEIAPNMQKYFNMNYGDYFSIVNPEGGAGYVYTCPPAETQYEFFKWTEEYMGRTGADTLRMLKIDYTDALPYAENVEGLNGILLGYMGEDEKMWNNNEDANFLYRDTVYFRHYDGRSMNELAKYNSTEPAFFSVSLYGWNQTASSVEAIMKGLDDRFVLVSPSELADLYKQYYADSFKDVTEANVDADMSKEEMGFLHYASDHTTVSQKDKTRSFDGKDHGIYKFDLKDTVTNAQAIVDVSGRYQIEVSTDYLNWGVVAKATKYHEETQQIKVDLNSFLENNPSKTVYVRVGDATEENASGAVLRHISVLTNETEVENVHLTTENDAMFVVDGQSEVTSSGRKGDFTYKFNIKDDVKNAEVAFDFDGAKEVKISTDGKSFTTLNLNSLNTTKYADISNYLSKTNTNEVWLSLTGAGKVKEFKIVSSAPVTELSFSPIGLSSDLKYAISLDDNKPTNVSSVSSYLNITGANEALYKFNIGEGVTSTRLDLNVTGTYDILVSNDGKSFTSVRKAVIGGGVQNSYVYTDITDYATAGKTVYVKIKLIDSTSDKSVRLFGIRLFTNLASESLKQRYENERPADFSFVPMWNGVNKDGNVNYGEEDVTSFEYLLLDQSLTQGATIYMHNYVQPLRTITSGDAYFTYKFDFSDDNMAFWKEHVPEVFDDDFVLTNFRVNVDIAEGYIAWVSTDGENWEKILDCGLDDTYRGGAANRQIEILRLGEYLESSEDKTVYVKFADNTPQNGWGALIFGMSLFFN